MPPGAYKATPFPSSTSPDYVARSPAELHFSSALTCGAIHLCLVLTSDHTDTSRSRTRWRQSSCAIIPCRKPKIKIFWCVRIALSFTGSCYDERP